MARELTNTLLPNSSQLAGRKNPQKLILLKEKEENQRKGRKEGRESKGREEGEKIFWVPPRTFITKLEVRPGNLNCCQLRVSPSLRSKLEEISKETKY